MIAGVTLALGSEGAVAKMTFAKGPPPPDATVIACGMPSLMHKGETKEYKAGCRFSSLGKKILGGGLVKVSCSRDAPTFFACAIEDEDLLRQGWRVVDRSRDGEAFKLMK